MPRAPTVTAVVATAALYLAAALAETALAHPEPRRVTGWWPSGVAVAAVWLAGRRAAAGAFSGTSCSWSLTAAGPGGWWLVRG